MCGRFDQDRSNKEIDRLLAQLPPGSLPPKLGETFPGNLALILGLSENAVLPQVMAWGFPRWDGKGLVFNARAESALQKPMFRGALSRQPAVIPVTGFYEWRKSPTQSRKEKFYFKAPDAPLLYLAGFWNTFIDEAVPRHFTILTTSANAAMSPYHHRMPVTLAKPEIEPWLTGDIRDEVLQRIPPPLHVEALAP